MNLDLSLLRRPYTRTIAKDIRSLPVLAASFADVKDQWCQLVLERRHNDIQDGGIHAGISGINAEDSVTAATSLLSGARQALVSAERIVSQLKAVKQELMVHLNQGQQSEAREFTPGAVQHVSNQGDSSFHQGGRADPDAVAYFSRLASTATLTSSVAVNPATHVTTEASSGHCSPQTTALRLARSVWLWSILLGCTLADMDLLSGSLAVAQHELYAVTTDSNVQCAVVRANAELVSYFFPAPTAKDCTLDVQKCSDDADTLFVHATALLYSILTDDQAGSARALQTWTELCVRQRPTPFSVLCESGVSALAACLSAGDSGGAAHVLARMFAASKFTHVAPGGCSKETMSLAATAFLLGLQLLVRMLTELDTRRALVKWDVGKAYRPVIVTSEDPSGNRSATANACGAPVLYSDCVQQAAHREHECDACRVDPPSSLSETRDRCMGHWPRRIQLQRLTDLSGPWPLPRDVVLSQFTFLLPA